MSRENQRVDTPLGAEIMLIDAIDVNGDTGIIFHIRMKDRTDHRNAEVFLDPLALYELVKALKTFQ